MVHTTHPRSHTWHLSIYPPRYFIIFLFITLLYLLLNMCSRLYTSKTEQSSRHYSVCPLPHSLNCCIHVTTNSHVATHNVHMFFKCPRKIGIVPLGARGLWLQLLLERRRLRYPFAKNTAVTRGARGGIVVKALRYKPMVSRWCHWNF